MRLTINILRIYVCLLVIVSPVFAVDVNDKGNVVEIRTDQYQLTWKESERMGYQRAVPAGLKDSLIDTPDNPFFHGGDYAGWEYWGTTDKVNIIEQSLGKAVIEYISKGTQIIAYSVTATYWDGVPFFKHEVRGKNISNEPRVWPISGYDPMVNPGIPFRDDKSFKIWKEPPIPHVAYWTADAYLGLYSANPKAKPKLGDWRGDGDLIQLDHDWQVAMLEKKQWGDPIIYFVALGQGGEAEAHAIADQVLKALEDEPKSVGPKGKISILWATLKAQPQVPSN